MYRERVRPGGLSYRWVTGEASPTRRSLKVAYTQVTSLLENFLCCEVWRSVAEQRQCMPPGICYLAYLLVPPQPPGAPLHAAGALPQFHPARYGTHASPP